MTGHYRLHLFVCTNRRDGDKKSCGASGTDDLRGWMKDRVKELKIEGVRINSSGCLGRCDEGPLAVIYPDEVWYRLSNRDDAEAIIQGHLRNGTIVDHLRVPGGKG